MSCSTKTAFCCEKQIVETCLPQNSYPFGTTATQIIFGPNPNFVAASGFVSNDSANSAVITFTFFRGTTAVATFSSVSPGQIRAFAINAFNTISATANVASGSADLCMTQFFRPGV